MAIKILFLVQKEQRAILNRLYDGIAANCDCDTRWLSDSQQADLGQYFKHNVDVTKYDRIVLFLRIKKEMRQVSFLQTIPNLVFLEHDAYQNYIPCKYTGKFSSYYGKIPWVRIISSGAVVSRRLREEGYDVCFVSKGYDQELLMDLGQAREIELGFIGSIKSSAYSERKDFLKELAKHESLFVTRTSSGEEYLNTLNRIRFFVGCDMGMGEYMIKNFEAMACGCVLFTYNQGEEENQAIGFKDMDNVVLYSSLNELQEKLALLRTDKALTEKIAKQGQELARRLYGFDKVGQRIVQALIPELRQPSNLSRWDRLRNFIKC